MRASPGGLAQAASPVRRARPLMGTIVAVSVCVPEEDVRGGERILEAAFAEMARLERILSEHDPRSDLSAVNAAAGRAAVRVPGELVQVLDTALAVARASDGAFDPTWCPLAEVWDFAAVPPRLPSRREIAERLGRVGHADVVLHPAASTVLLRRPGMRLGLGGVAKAFIAERAAELAAALGATGVLVDAGGDVVARGANHGRPWRVAVRDPRRPGAALGSIELPGAALATSGDSEQGFVAGGRRWHHLLDPRSGYPARGVRSVSVMAPGGAQADALATALFVLGPDTGERLLASARGARALWVLDGRG